MIVYYKLGKILKERNMQWKDLLNAGISVNIPYKLSSNKIVKIDTLNRVCEYLHVQPGDIMEWIPDEDYTEESAEKKKLEAEMAAIQAKLKKINETEA